MSDNNLLIDTTGRELTYTHRRIIPNSRDAHSKDDFLKGGPGDPLGTGADLGVSSTRHTKFTSGFFRRPAHVINPYDERLRQEEAKAEKLAARSMAREEYLAQQNCRHGNVVNTMMGRPHEEGLVLNARDSSLQSHKERRNVRQFHTEGENRNRQMASGNRYHAVNDAKAEGRRRQRMEANIMRQIGSSSVLGYGRKDLPSYGVWDNFRVDEEKSSSVRAASSQNLRDEGYRSPQYKQTQVQQQSYSASPSAYNSRSNSRREYDYGQQTQQYQHTQQQYQQAEY